MKKNLIIALTFFMAMSQMNAQETKFPTITVTGEGKVKVVPDQVALSVSLETKGVKAAEVKKENDTKIDAVLKYIKKMGIASEDFKTTRVSLNDQYDYEKKKHNYVAFQTIEILVKDLSKYDQLMEGLVDTGINNIGNIEFKSSKIEFYKSAARKSAALNAKMKGEDYAKALDINLGSVLTMVDNSIDYSPQPRYEMMALKMADSMLGRNETLATGEIEVTANVSITFYLKD